MITYKCNNKLIKIEEMINYHIMYKLDMPISSVYKLAKYKNIQQTAKDYKQCTRPVTFFLQSHLCLPQSASK